MSAAGEDILNTVMGHFMSAIYVLFPASCVAAVAYDVWARGLASLPAQICLGILGLFIALRLMAYAFAAADFTLEATGNARKAVRKMLAPWSARVRDAVNLHGGRQLSQA